MLRNVSLVLALCVVSPLWLPQGVAIECFECSGDYNSNCGLQFYDSIQTSTIQCNGTCAAYTTDFKTVTRGCSTNELQSPGCRYNDQGQFTCVYLCDTDWCNGVGALPLSDPVRCYSCNGSYASSPCGYNFNAALVSGQTCDGFCAAITTDFSYVSRQCTNVSLVRPGCRYNNANQFVCVYLCRQSLCNGADVIPVTAEPTIPAIGLAAQDQRAFDILAYVTSQTIVSLCLHFFMFS